MSKLPPALEARYGEASLSFLYNPIDLLDRIPFPDATIARFLQVERQAIHNWRKGGSITFDNYRRLFYLFRWKKAVYAEILRQALSSVTPSVLNYFSEEDKSRNSEPHEYIHEEYIEMLESQVLDWFREKTGFVCDSSIDYEWLMMNTSGESNMVLLHKCNLEGKNDFDEDCACKFWQDVADAIDNPNEIVLKAIKENTRSEKTASQ